MKVIDLLEKIANGEEVPKKIKYTSLIWEYNKEIKDYFNDDLWLFYSLNSIGLIEGKVEIIEDTSKEDKKIEKIELTNGGLTLHKIIEGIEEDISIDTVERTIIYKLNEIIDKINENDKK